jgi:NAD(P)-dependent dehydrogenase (short-subunit alcohol dehydrogenase family)
MSKTIIIVGFGPGVSTAVAERFGAEGFSVALIARSQARLTAGVEALKAKGITSAGFPADASDPVAIRSAIAKARSELGRVGVIHWNAYSGHGLGDLLAADPASVKNVFDVAIVGLLSAVQEALPDLKEARDGAVLVTNGAFGDLNPVVDAVAIKLKAEGVALGNGAKAKLVGLLAARLKDEGVFVGEVTIGGVVRGTGPEIPGVPMIEGEAVADAFWRLFKARGDVRARVG